MGWFNRVQAELVDGGPFVSIRDGDRDVLEIFHGTSGGVCMRVAVFAWERFLRVGKGKTQRQRRLACACMGLEQWWKLCTYVHI